MSKYMFKSNLSLRIAKYLGRRGCLNFLSDESYVSLVWYLMYGTCLNLKKPKTFSEKLQWLKIKDHNRLYTRLVDKIEVRSYVAAKIGARYLIPVLWQGINPEEIPYSELPNRFVIKCTHGSHCNIICKDKSLLDVEETKNKLKKWLKTNWFFYSREWPYLNIQPRILIEEFMEDMVGEEIKDYKFFCFSGKVEFCQVIGDRSTIETMDFFDKNWNVVNIKRQNGNGDFYPNSTLNILKPPCYDEMLFIAEKLSCGFKFARVDLYCIKGKTYFGEITFYPAAGYCEFYPSNINEILGELIMLED